MLKPGVRYNQELGESSKKMSLGRPKGKASTETWRRRRLRFYKTRAREVWQSQLKATPDNPVLLETMRRHAP